MDHTLRRIKNIRIRFFNANRQSPHNLLCKKKFNINVVDRVQNRIGCRVRCYWAKNQHPYIQIDLKKLAGNV